MKRFIIAAALVLAPAVASAQSVSTSAGIATAVTVKSAVTLTMASDLNLGSAIPGATAGITEKGVTSSGGTIGSVVLSANEAVDVSAIFSALNGAGSSLTVSPLCSHNSSNAAASATSFACGTGYTSPAAGTGTGHYVFLGGSVVIPAGQVAGAYTGTATVTGTYLNY